jgi:predicted secreted protein with PEFG-CTERM motif
MISEYWLANMRASNVFCATLVAIMIIFGSPAMVLIPTQTVPTNITNVGIKPAYASAAHPCPNGTCTMGQSITSLSVNPTYGQAPLLVSFKVSFTGAMKNIDWHFGDGSPDTLNVNSTTHTYPSAGNFTGSVQVYFTDGTDQSQIFNLAISGTIGAGAGAIQSPRGNTTNAYQLFLHEHNNTLTATSQPPLSVATNSPRYGQGDTVVIHGAVKEISNATAITVRITNPLRNLVSIAQLIPASDGSFSKSLLATGPLWTTAGNYTVIAQYGPTTNASASFYFSGGNGQSIINKLVNGTYSIQAGQVMYNIPYSIQGGTVQNMQTITSQSSLVITISSTSDGAITVNLPRALIDSKQQPPVNTGVNNTMTTQYNQAELPDQPFMVQINGQNIKISETTNPNSRTLGIPFHKGDTTIYVIGTIAIPEFGPIAALVLVIAIVSIIAVSAKTGLRFMPKNYRTF